LIAFVLALLFKPLGISLLGFGFLLFLTLFTFMPTAQNGTETTNYLPGVTCFFTNTNFSDDKPSFPCYV
jgi:hypothetical protein